METDLRIVVMVKQVPDPEGPASAYIVDEEARRVIPRGIPPVINPYDENALEAALLLKEAHGGRITLLSVGYKQASVVFLKALATGADELVVIDDAACDREKLDSYGSAFWLAAALRRTGLPQIILAGRQASDTNGGQVAIGVARLLDIPVVTMARRIDLKDGVITAERVLPDGYEVVAVRTPALVTVSHEAGELRFPPISGIKKAKEKPYTTLTLAELGLEAPPPRAALLALHKPALHRCCQFIEGECGSEIGERLAARLVAEKAVSLPGAATRGEPGGERHDSGKG